MSSLSVIISTMMDYIVCILGENNKDTKNLICNNNSYANEKDNNNDDHSCYYYKEGYEDNYYYHDDDDSCVEKKKLLSCHHEDEKEEELDSCYKEEDLKRHDFEDEYSNSSDKHNDIYVKNIKDEGGLITLERIQGMIYKSFKLYQIKNDYLSFHECIIDVQCRTQMCQWIIDSIDYFGLSYETAYTAINLMDRFVSIRKEYLQSKALYQLVCVTSLHIAIKTLEPVELNIQLLIQMCRGCYSEQQIYDTELQILWTLQWTIHPPSPRAIAFDLITYIWRQDKFDRIKEDFNELINQQCLVAMKDYQCTLNYSPITIAMACILNSMLLLQINENNNINTSKLFKIMSHDDLGMVNKEHDIQMIQILLLTRLKENAAALAAVSTTTAAAAAAFTTTTLVTATVIETSKSCQHYYYYDECINCATNHCEENDKNNNNDRRSSKSPTTIITLKNKEHDSCNNKDYMSSSYCSTLSFDTKTVIRLLCKTAILSKTVVSTMLPAFFYNNTQTNSKKKIALI